MNTMDTLRRFPLVYLASPYSKYELGIEQAFIDVSALAARLMLAGVKIYSPIAHTHPLAIHGNIDPYDHSIWIPFDEAMMTACNALLVAQMQGWEKSYGVNHEIEFFFKARKPIFYLRPSTIEVGVDPHRPEIASA